MTLNDFLKTKNGLSICWFGNDGFAVNSNGTLFSFDLYFSDSERIEPFNFDVSDLMKNLSYFFITHEHEDHFNSETVNAFLKNGACTFVVPESCKEKAKKLNIPQDRLLLAKPGDEFSFCGINVRCIRAIHGHIGGTVYSGASTSDCGYLIDACGMRMYQPGDTLLLEEHLEMQNVDVLFVSPTEHNTWIDGSKRLIELLCPKFIFPQHHSTYVEADDNRFWTHGYVEELYKALTDEYKEKYHVLPQGEPFKIK